MTLKKLMLKTSAGDQLGDIFLGYSLKISQTLNLIWQEFPEISYQYFLEKRITSFYLIQNSFHIFFHRVHFLSNFLKDFTDDLSKQRFSPIQGCLFPEWTNKQKLFLIIHTWVREDDSHFGARSKNHRHLDLINFKIKCEMNDERCELQILMNHSFINSSWIKVSLFPMVTITAAKDKKRSFLLGFQIKRKSKKGLFSVSREWYGVCLKKYTLQK